MSWRGAVREPDGESDSLSSRRNEFRVRLEKLAEPADESPLRRGPCLIAKIIPDNLFKKSPETTIVGRFHSQFDEPLRAASIGEDLMGTIQTRSCVSTLITTAGRPSCGSLGL